MLNIDFVTLFNTQNKADKILYLQQNYLSFSNFILYFYSTNNKKFYIPKSMRKNTLFLFENLSLKSGSTLNLFKELEDLYKTRHNRNLFPIEKINTIKSISNNNTLLTSNCQQNALSLHDLRENIKMQYNNMKVNDNFVSFNLHFTFYFSDINLTISLVQPFHVKITEDELYERTKIVSKPISKNSIFHEKVTPAIDKEVHFTFNNNNLEDYFENNKAW